MNVLFVVPWDNIGGVSHVVNRVAQHVLSQGHGVHFLLPGRPARDYTPSETTSRMGFPAYRMSLRHPWIPGRSFRARLAFALTLPITLVRIAGLVRRLRIDVVNIHYPGGQSIYFALLRRMGIVRLVTSIHGADMLPNGSRRLSHAREVVSVLAASDVVVTPSDSFRDAVYEAWPELSAPTRTIPNGVDPEELGYSPELPDRTDDPPFILSILQMVHYKGVDVLIRAFAALTDEYPRLTMRLISDGPQRADFEALAESLGVRDRIDFLGFQERDIIRDQLQRCALFVLPSRTNSESFGIAVAEAMTMDRPVIASRIGGLPELVEDGVSGLLVPPGEVAALEGAMRRLLADRALRESLGRAGGRRVRQQFLWSRTCTLYEDMFEELVAAPVPPEKRRPAGGSTAVAAGVADYPETHSTPSGPRTHAGTSQEGW